METPDGRWRVEAHQLRANAWYRVLHDGQVFTFRDGRHEVAADHLAIGTVEYLLRRAGVDMAQMREVDG